MKKSVLFIFAACLFAACAKEVPTAVESPSSDSTAPATTASAPVFYASVESGTRTFVDGLDVCWAAGDEISIFNRNSFNSEYVYAGEPGATSGAFNPVAVDTADTVVPYVYAAYPYNKDSEIYEDLSLSLWFSPQQTYVPGTFDPASAVMVAASENENLKFRNACGFLKVRLWGDASAPVSMVYIQGNDGELISGYRVVTVSPDEAPVSAPDTQWNTYDYVAVVDDSESLYLGETAEDAVEFWLAIPPVKFESGITISVLNTENGWFNYTSTTPLEIKRGVIKTTAPLEVTFTVNPPVSPKTGKYTVNNGEYPFGIELVEYVEGDPSQGYLLYANWFDMSSSDYIAPVLYFTADETAWTLTCDGKFYYNGELEDGAFGSGFYYYDQSQNQVFVFFGGGAGDNPITITYDEEGLLQTISYCEYGVVDFNTNEYLGYYDYCADGTTISPATETAAETQSMMPKARSPRAGQLTPCSLVKFTR